VENAIEEEDEICKLVVTEFVSVDGVFEDPGGAEGYEHGGWTFEYERGDDGDTFKLDEVMEAEVQLLGRVTYAGFAARPLREGSFAEHDQPRERREPLQEPTWRLLHRHADPITSERPGESVTQT